MARRNTRRQRPVNATTADAATVNAAAPSSPTLSEQSHPPITPPNPWQAVATFGGRQFVIRISYASPNAWRCWTRDDRFFRAVSQPGTIHWLGTTYHVQSTWVSQDSAGTIAELVPFEFNPPRHLELTTEELSSWLAGGLGRIDRTEITTAQFNSEGGIIPPPASQ